MFDGTSVRLQQYNRQVGPCKHAVSVNSVSDRVELQQSRFHMLMSMMVLRVLV